MRFFITGGTGFIGQRLAEKLASGNNEVVLLIRNPEKAGKFTSENISFVKGHILDEDALKKGMEKCDMVFHMAAYTKPWSKDPGIPYKINVEGTIKILEGALLSGVRKVVITSTAGTMSFSRDGRPVDETTNPDPVFHTSYEKTKAEAEKIAKEYSERGLDVVIVNPARVYGPGELTKSNSLTRIIKMYKRGLWRILPGSGESVGNYVYVDDVVEGHLLAAEKGISGERYILGGENLTFSKLFSIMGEACGKTRNLIRLPLPLLKAAVNVTGFFSGLTGLPPLITREWLDKYMNNWIMSSEKAEKHLGYRITPFYEGVTKTLEWLVLCEKRT